MKKFSKIGALVLAMMMILAMSVPVFADTTTDGAGTLASGNPAIRTISSNTLTLNKTIIFFNPETVAVYEPNISYEYTIAPFDVTEGSAKIDDGITGHTPAAVNDGVDGGLKFGGTDPTKTTVTFSDDHLVADVKPNGTTVEKTFDLTIVPSVFPHAGVYRYVLTETDNATDRNNVGVTRGTDYNNVRYIDLYVKNELDSSNNPTGNKTVTNVVVFATTTSTLNPATGTVTTTTEKTTGFNEGTPTTPNDYTTDTKADHYYTYNLKVEKKVSGALADASHEFPFAVEITGIKADKITSGATAAAAVETPVVSNKVGGTDLNAPTFKLANAQSFTYFGIPYGATASVMEYNDTYDTYTATGAKAGTSAALTLPNGATLTSREPSSCVSISGILIDSANAHSSDDTTQKSTATTVITLTNTIVEVSPTGVVLRVAPFVGIMGAGLFLLLIAKRSKKDEDEDEDAVLETIPQNN